MSISTPSDKEANAWPLSDAATRALQIALGLMAAKNLVDALPAGPIGLFALGLDIALFFLVRRRYPRAPRLILLRALTMTLFWFMLAFFPNGPASAFVIGILEGWFGLSLILLSAGRPGNVRAISGLSVAILGLFVYLSTLLLALLAG
jgi:hypothetical protein